MGWKNCVLLPAIGKQNATFSPNFTQPGKRSLEVSCTCNQASLTVSGSWRFGMLERLRSVELVLNFCSKYSTLFELKCHLNWHWIEFPLQPPSRTCTWTSPCRPTRRCRRARPTPPRPPSSPSTPTKPPSTSEVWNVNVKCSAQMFMLGFGLSIQLVQIDSSWSFRLKGSCLSFC